MTLEEAIAIGKDCGLNTPKECMNNIILHAIQIFDHETIDEELEELFATSKHLCEIPKSSINLNNLRIGDEVVLRDSTTHIITQILTQHEYNFSIRMENSNPSVYLKSGQRFSSKVEDPSDIISIIKKDRNND